MPKKPTGERYSAILTHGGSSADVQHVKFPWPDSKPEIERLVINAFDRSFDLETRRRFGITQISPSASENDLDCSIDGAGGKWQMDLTEYVPIDLSKGGYQSAKAEFTSQELADSALTQIRRKDDHYSGNVGSWLLIYATAWQFNPGNNALLLVSRSLMRRPPKLARTLFIRIHPDLSAEITTLHPVDLFSAYQLCGINPEALGKTIVRNLDSRKFEGHVDDGEGARFMLRPQPS
jgi:hypothetical protein